MSGTRSASGERVETRRLPFVRRRAEERIAFFAEEETPVSLVIVADSSASMKGKLVVCAQATAELFRGSLPGDEFALITFAAKPRVAVPLDSRCTGDRGGVAARACRGHHGPA